jgi:Flp pilus assembly protein TadG
MKQRNSELTSVARVNAERGATMFLVAMTVLIVMVAGAIAVDLAAAATRGQSLQNAADSAALAGVQAYRQSMGDRTEANSDDEAAAVAAVNALLEQNGIFDITPGIDFPDAANDAEVKVTLFDDDVGYLL